MAKRYLLALGLVAVILVAWPGPVQSQVTGVVMNVTNLVASTASSYLTVRLSDGSNFLTPSADATHDSAAGSTGPQEMGECDDSSTDAVDEGDAGRLRVNCTTRALFTQPTGGKLGGAGSVTMLSDNTDNDDETAVCTGPCTVYSVTAFNHAAAAAFVSCENDTAANTTPGSETAAAGEPMLEIPGSTTGAGFTVAWPVGISFDTALTCWIHTGEAESDATDAATDDVRVIWSRVQ